MSDRDDGPVSATATTEARLRAVTIGALSPLTGPIELADYDPAWPSWFEDEATRIRAALGDRVLRLEQVGSTAVPGLAAKPIIDILLVVADSSEERAYVPPLESAGYVLRIREPDLDEHRMFKRPDRDLNLHVLSAGCPEIDRMVAFRDRLRTHEADRALYERTKRELAARRWTYAQEYADAKSEIIESILLSAAQVPPAQPGRGSG